MDNEYLQHYYQSKQALISFPNGSQRPIEAIEFKLASFTEYTLYVRPVIDITFHEAVYIANLAFGLENKNYDLTDYRAKINKTTIEVYIDNNHYIETCFIGKSGDNIWTLNGRSDRPHTSVQRTYNTAKIFHYMTKHCGFDVFGLIHNGIAQSREKDIRSTDTHKLTEEYTTLHKK